MDKDNNPSPLRTSARVVVIKSSDLEYHPDDDVLGVGAQGTVYKAKWKASEVVFKKLHKGHVGITERQQFMRELTVWSNIRHPNSVQLFGVVDEAGKCGYVTEYCHNGSLYPLNETEEFMKKGYQMNPIQTIEVALGVADTLALLHNSLISHRDIKSANIMLDREFRPKLGDFGLSRMVDDFGASATNLSGTPTHMAPEQTKQGAKHDPMKADVYSFGMLLYELATQKVPFYGCHTFEIFSKLEKGDRPPIPADEPPGLDTNERKCWWDIVTRCWANDPNARPSINNVLQMVLALYRIMRERITDTVNALFDLVNGATRNNGEHVKVFLDSRCLPDAEDWEKSFLYGLHHSKVIVPIISTPSWERFSTANGRKDNVLVEYENMLSILATVKGKAKVFPLFIGTRPRSTDYPDRLHVTGKNIRKTVEGILRLQGISIHADALAHAIPALLDKLDELDSGANSNLTWIGGATVSDNDQMQLFILSEGDASTEQLVEVNSTATLQHLRACITQQLNGFECEYAFLRKLGGRVAVISDKQESVLTAKSIVDDSTIVVRKKANLTTDARNSVEGHQVGNEGEYNYPSVGCAQCAAFERKYEDELLKHADTKKALQKAENDCKEMKAKLELAGEMQLFIGSKRVPQKQKNTSLTEADDSAETLTNLSAAEWTSLHAALAKEGRSLDEGIAKLSKDSHLVYKVAKSVGSIREVHDYFKRAANELENAAKTTAAAEFEDDEAQYILTEMSNCVMGKWLKVEGGYRCAGGSHFVSHEEINKYRKR